MTDYTIEGMENEIAKAIHYPECWDEVVYPSLVIALWEGYLLPKDKLCPTCKRKQVD